MNAFNFGNVCQDICLNLMNSAGTDGKMPYTYSTKCRIQKLPNLDLAMENTRKAGTKTPGEKTSGRKNTLKAKKC